MSRPARQKPLKTQFGYSNGYSLKVQQQQKNGDNQQNHWSLPLSYLSG